MLIAAIRAEHLKLRHTFARALVVLMPAVGLALALIGLESATDWRAFATPALRAWAVVLLPLLVTLQAAQLGQLEHASGQWRHLLVHPIPRASLLLAKFVQLQAMLLGAHVLLALSLVATAWFAGLAKQESLGAAISQIGGRVVFIHGAALLFTALQLVLSLEIASFAAVVTGGLVATLFAALLAPQIGALADLLPWTMPLRILGGDAAMQARIVGWSVVAGGAVLAFGARRLVRREIA